MTMTGELIREANDGHGIVCREVFYPPETRIEPHAHELPFFALSMAGVFTESVGQSSFDYRPRDVVYHGAGEEHAVSVGAAHVRCFVLEMRTDLVEKRFGVRLPLSMFHRENSPLASFLTTAYSEFRHPDSVSWLAIQGQLIQLLVAVSRISVDRDQPRWLNRVTELLRERFRTRLTLDEISAEVGVSAERISSVFRRRFRRSLADEQRRLRVEFACRLLLDGTTSLSEVALKAGFADQPHFSRAFKSVTGMTPAQYRGALTASSASK